MKDDSVIKNEENENAEKGVNLPSQEDRPVEGEPKNQGHVDGEATNSVKSRLCCRICQEDTGDDLLTKSCNCKGSIGMVHEHCLVTWINVSNRDCCELCGFKWKMLRTLKPIREWQWHNFPRLPLFWIVFCLVISAVNAVLLTAGFRDSCKEKNSCIFIYVVSGIGATFTLLLCISWVRIFLEDMKVWMNQNHNTRIDKCCK